MLKEVAKQFRIEPSPSNLRRIEKAQEMVGNGDVHRRSDYLWEVKGSHPEPYTITFYPEAPNHAICNCHDYVSNGFPHRCKHGIAVLLQLNINQALGG